MVRLTGYCPFVVTTAVTTKSNHSTWLLPINEWRPKLLAPAAFQMSGFVRFRRSQMLGFVRSLTLT